MKIKDLIKHLQTLDGDKELVIIATDPTDWNYGKVVKSDNIQLETITPTEDNGLEGELNVEGAEEHFELDEMGGDVECYVIRMDV